MVALHPIPPLRLVGNIPHMRSQHQDENVGRAPAAKYMDACQPWEELQTNCRAAATQRNPKPEEIVVFAKNELFANDLQDLGNAIPIGTLKSLARRSPELLNVAKAKFTQVDAKLTELRGMTPDAEETRVIVSCAGAACSVLGTATLLERLTLVININGPHRAAKFALPQV